MKGAEAVVGGRPPLLPFASRDEVLILAKLCLPRACIILSLSISSRVTHGCGQGTQAHRMRPLLEGGLGEAPVQHPQVGRWEWGRLFAGHLKVLRVW